MRAAEVKASGDGLDPLILDVYEEGPYEGVVLWILGMLLAL